MVKKIQTTILFRLLLLSTLSFSQKENLYFETFSTEDGLPHTVVIDVVQDSKGYLWFATAGGLTKYDGYNFDYKHGNIDFIFIDKDDRIWYQKRNEPVEIFDLESETTTKTNLEDISIIFQSKSSGMFYISKDGELGDYRR